MVGSDRQYRPERFNKCSWGEAEIEVMSQLQMGVHPDIIMKNANRQVGISLWHSTNHACCQRIIENMRWSGMFVRLPTLADYYQIRLLEYERIRMEMDMFNMFRDASAFRRAAMDEQTAVTVANDPAPNKEEETKLQGKEKEEKRKAEKKHEEDQKELEKLKRKVDEAKADEEKQRTRADVAEATLDLFRRLRSGSSVRSSRGSDYTVSETRRRNPSPDRGRGRSIHSAQATGYLSRNGESRARFPGRGRGRSDSQASPDERGSSRVTQFLGGLPEAQDQRAPFPGPPSYISVRKQDPNHRSLRPQNDRSRGPPPASNTRYFENFNMQRISDNLPSSRSRDQYPRRREESRRDDPGGRDQDRALENTVSSAQDGQDPRLRRDEDDRGRRRTSSGHGRSPCILSTSSMRPESSISVRDDSRRRECTRDPREGQPFNGGYAFSVNTATARDIERENRNARRPSPPPPHSSSPPCRSYTPRYTSSPPRDHFSPRDRSPHGRSSRGCRSSSKAASFLSGFR